MWVSQLWRCLPSQQLNGNRRLSAWAMCLSRNDPVTQDNLLSFLWAVFIFFLPNYTSQLYQCTEGSVIYWWTRGSLVNPVLLGWAVMLASWVVTWPAGVVQDHESTLNLNLNYNFPATAPTNQQRYLQVLPVGHLHFVCLCVSVIQESGGGGGGEAVQPVNWGRRVRLAGWSVSGCSPPTYTHTHTHTHMD